jgi:cellulose synthase operon protein C
MAFRRSAALAVALLAIGSARAVPVTAEARADMWVSEARALFSKGDAGGATRAIEAALKLDPKNTAALVYAGNLVRDRYGLLPALPWYDRALTIKPGHEDALFEKAATLGDAGRARDMLATSRQLLAVSPNNPKAFYLQAVLAARAGKWELARGLIYRIGKRMDAVPGMLLVRGAATVQTGANDEAIATLRTLTEMQPENMKARRLLGLALWRVGDNGGAIEILRPLAEGGDRYALTITGRALEAMGNRVAAGVALDRTAQAGVVTPNPQTLAALDAFLAANPDNAYAQRLAADRSLSRGEWDGASALYASLATRLGHRDPVRLANAGWAEIGRERFEGAAAFGARAYALAPMNAVTVASYGSFLARAGRKAEAIPMLEKAIALAPAELRFAQELAAARKSP